MRRVNIIHLSDIHFDDSEEVNKLLEQLEADLLEQKSEFGDYHMLIITGDVVNKGNVELFETFKKKLNKILRKCQISKKNVIISIGNHDINLKNLWLTSFSLAMTENETNEDILNKIKGQTGTLYSEYNKFNKNYAETENGIGVLDIPIKKDKNQIMRLRIINLNSSVSTAFNNKYGKLIIGDEQLEIVKQLINNKRTKNYDYTFLCMHHPLDWFTYEERLKLKTFMEDCHVDFFLHGHIHESHVEDQYSADTSTHTLCTGISYQKTGETSTKKSGMRYSIYQIDKDTKTLNVFIRSTNEKGKFIEDNSLYTNVKNGLFTIPLEHITKCLMPFKTVERIPKLYAVLTQENVKRILDKEKLLFEFYKTTAAAIDTEYSKNSENYIKYYNEYKSRWLNENGIDPTEHKRYKKMPKEFEEKFAEDRFGYFCLFVLLQLNSKFFHGNVRFLIRSYNKDTNSHEAFLADGPNSDKIENITSFKWKTGLIYQSFKHQSALLQSANRKYYQKGNSDKWINSLTLVVDGITVTNRSETIPLLTLNIAITSGDDEACLEAIALSSIYEKIGAVFRLYDRKVKKIKTIFYKEDDE